MGSTVSIGVLSFLAALTVVVALVIVWVIVSIPVWLAAKVVTAGSASFPSAMAATLLGPIVYGVVLMVATFFLSAVIGPPAVAWALVPAFIAWLGVYKATFSTGWLGALGITIIATLVFFVLSLILGMFLGALFPAPRFTF